MLSNARYLFALSNSVMSGRCNEQSCPSIGSDPSGVCICRFPGRPVTHIYNMENMVLQESEAVSPIPGDRYYYYYYYYILYLPFKEFYLRTE